MFLGYLHFVPTPEIPGLQRQDSSKGRSGSSVETVSCLLPVVHVVSGRCQRVTFKIQSYLQHPCEFTEVLRWMCSGNHSSVAEVNLQSEELDLLSGQPKGSNLGFACVSQACPSVLSLAQQNLVQTVATKHNEQFKYLLGI